MLVIRINLHCRSDVMECVIEGEAAQGDHTELPRIMGSHSPRHHQVTTTPNTLSDASYQFEIKFLL